VLGVRPRFEVGGGVGSGEGKAIELCRPAIHAHRAIEHPVRVIEGVSDGENIDGKTVALARGSSVKLEFLNRASVDVSHALDRFGGKGCCLGHLGYRSE
jgi:hypothetical protein